MRKQLLVGIGALLVLIGLLWTGQGFGWIGDSGMSGHAIWAVIGIVVALAGVALAVTGSRRTDQSQ
jgi:hypothetical protein